MHNTHQFFQRSYDHERNQKLPHLDLKRISPSCVVVAFDIVPLFVEWFEHVFFDILRNVADFQQ